MLFVPFAGQRKDAPDLRLAAGFGEDFGFLAGHDGGRLIHLLGVVHDPVGRIFREDNEIHSRQTGLHADDHVGDLFGVRQHLGLGVKPRHLVVHDGDADRVVA